MTNLPMADDQRPMDPVCGMRVNPEVARAAGLTAQHDGTTYYFCGPGCRLDFIEDPERYLAAGYQPRM